MSRITKASLIAFLTISVLFMPIKPFFICAQEDLQEELTEEKREELTEEKREELTEEEILRKHEEYKERRRLFEESKKAGKKYQFKFNLSVKEGYDNNVYLSPKRKGSMLDDISFGTDLRYRLNRRSMVKLTTNSNLFNYHEITDYSTINNSTQLSLDYFLNKKARLATGYNMSFVNYLKNENGTNYNQGPFADLQYFITSKFFVGCGYGNSFYQYDKRKSRNGKKNDLEFVREDIRHKITAETGALIGESFLKVKNTYQFNDSNDEYMDYYDYQSDKTSALLTYGLTKNAKLIFTSSYQRKDYQSRLLGITSSKTKVREHLMILGCSLHYKPVPSVNFITSYKYSQNNSNNPSQEYSGSTSSAGITYSF